MNFYVDTTGRWSGGGKAFLNNARHAAARHAILRGDPRTATPIIARNFPPRGSRIRGKHVLAPQNAWPWSPVASGIHEHARVVTLRVASELSLRRASALLRISSAIPSAPNSPTSPILHNVLDEGFEEALEASRNEASRWPGHLVSIGSGYSYRNLPGLLAGYRAYRAAGGSTPLLIAGPPGSRAAMRDTHQAALGLAGVTLVWKALPRAQCLATMREAAAVIMPSRVEASPLTALEACTMTPRVLMADIESNREILAPYGGADTSGQLFVDPSSPHAMATALATAESGGAASPWHHNLKRHDVRAHARDNWGQDLVTWLSQVQTSAP